MHESACDMKEAMDKCFDDHMDKVTERCKALGVDVPEPATFDMGRKTVKFDILSGLK